VNAMATAAGGTPGGTTMSEDTVVAYVTVPSRTVGGCLFVVCDQGSGAAYSYPDHPPKLHGHIASYQVTACLLLSVPQQCVYRHLLHICCTNKWPTVAVCILICLQLTH
jgi:hypothetical protein